MSRYAYAILLSLAVVGCNNDQATAGNKPSDSGTKQSAPAVATLKSEDLEKGTGPVAANGDYVFVLYRGTLMNGNEFDSNMTATHEPKIDKDPFSLVVGAGSVIKGWDEGLVGVQEGTLRKLQIPYAKAYGEAGSGEKIPPKSDLQFEVKVLKVLKKGVVPEIEAKTITPGTGAPITASSTISFKYVGTYLNGKVFDKRDEIKSTPVAKLVNGFGDALMGLKKGGKRKISFPPGLGKFEGIQNNQFMIFDVEILDVK